MSLEQALKENTEALNRFTALFEKLHPTTETVEPITFSIDQRTEEAAEVETPTEPEPVVETEVEAVAAAVTYTRDDVKSALMQVAKKSRDDLAAILAKFNVTNISSIQESDFAEVIQLAENANA